MSDSTDVDADAVLEFAHRVHGRAGDVAADTAQLQLPISGANLGASGMAESVVAAGTYAAATQATAAFLQDVQDGLTALGYVAVAVARNYRAGDAAQAGSMATVTAAFAPAPGQVSVSSQRAEQEIQAEDRRRSDESAAREALLFSNRVGAPSPSPEEQRLRNQLDAAPHPAAGSANDQYSRASDAVRARDELVGDDGVLAEAAYSPAADHATAAETAERLSAAHHIPYTVVVDEHGVSQVVQVDPDDVPDPAGDAVDERNREAADLDAALGGTD